MNVSQLFTLDRMALTELVGALPAKQARLLDDVTCPRDFGPAVT